MSQARGRESSRRRSSTGSDGSSPGPTEVAETLAVPLNLALDVVVGFGSSRRNRP